jgi:uncharacterized membrane protein YphA (DoxX/SURF4 family)
MNAGWMMSYLAIGIRCLIGAVFLTSSISKVWGRGAWPAFVSSLRRLTLLPPRVIRPAAWLVMLTEFAVCLLLAVPRTATAGLVLATGLLVVLAVGIHLAVTRGATAPCRCFGASATPLVRRHVWRNIVLAFVAGVGAVVTPAAGPVPAAGLAVPVAAGLLLGGLVIVSDDILELFRPVDRRA